MRKQVIAWMLLGLSVSAVVLGGAVQSVVAADPQSRLVVFEGFYRPT